MTGLYGNIGGCSQLGGQSGRMGPIPFLPVKVTTTVGTIVKLNGPNFGDRLNIVMCEQGFTYGITTSFLCLGYRHVRLRSYTNQPQELSTLFVFSRLLDECSPGLLNTSLDSSFKEDKESKWPLRGVFSPKSEKEVRILAILYLNRFVYLFIVLLTIAITVEDKIHQEQIQFLISIFGG